MEQFGKDILALIEGWNTIFAKARKEFPLATEEDLYLIAKNAMTNALQSKQEKT